MTEIRRFEFIIFFYWFLLRFREQKFIRYFLSFLYCLGNFFPISCPLLIRLSKLPSLLFCPTIFSYLIFCPPAVFCCLLPLFSSPFNSSFFSIYFYISLAIFLFEFLLFSHPFLFLLSSFPLSSSPSFLSTFALSLSSLLLSSFPLFSPLSPSSLLLSSFPLFSPPLLFFLSFLLSSSPLFPLFSPPLLFFLSSLLLSSFSFSFLLLSSFSLYRCLLLSVKVLIGDRS